jgi:hypothetical protein
MKHYAVNELQTYYSPELKKIGTIKELTQGSIGVEPLSYPPLEDK